MGKINAGRVILGGLLASVVFVVVEATVEWTVGFLFGVSEQELLLQASSDLTLSGARYHLVNLASLLAICTLAVWVYAAIRPRFGPGPKTALVAGLIFWFTMLLIAVSLLNLGVLPLQLTLMSVAFNLIEFPIAVIFGASIYRED